jgi:hypothetical protein
LNSLEKIKRKAFQNSEKRKKIEFGPSSPVQPSQANLSATDASSHSLPLSLPLPSGANLSVPVSFTHTPYSLCLTGPARQRWLPVRSPALADLWVPPVGFVPPKPPAHDPPIAVDSAQMTHAKAALVPTLAFSSCPILPLALLLPHSCTRSTLTLTSHRARTHGTPPPSAV